MTVTAGNKTSHGFKIRILRGDADYTKAVEAMNALAIRPEGSLDADEQEQLDLLALIVEQYDREHAALDTSSMTPLRALQYLMEANDLRPVDLAETLGGQNRVSEVLSGKRELSKAQIRALAKRFCVDAGLFI